MKKIYIFIALLILTSCHINNSQKSASGRLMGKITDGKSPISHANIVIFQGKKQLNATQSELDGIYTIKQISRGKYDVQVTCIGYQTQKMINVPINLDKITFIDFKLSTLSSKKDTIMGHIKK